jgi:hypothetical protein
MPDSHVRAQGSTRDAVKEFFAAERRNSERIERFNRGLNEDDELPPYDPAEHPYPKALYAPDGETAVVANAKEERERIAQGWFATLAEAQEAAEGEAPFDVDPDEPSDFTLPDKPKRSHSKKKPAAA